MDRIKKAVQMLSTAYRLRLQFICSRIANGQPVKLEDRIWATKLGQSNRSADTMLRQARRKANNPDMPPEGLDSFLNALDIGAVDEESKGITSFNTPDEIANYFRRKNEPDWRQRD